MIQMTELMFDWDFVQPGPVTILRGTGSYDGHGLYEPAGIESFQVVMIIQQSSPKQLEALPEGERNNDTINWWLNPELIMADGIVPRLSDVIMWRSKYYRIIRCADRSDNGFYNGMAQAAPNTGGTVNPDRESLHDELARRQAWAIPGSSA